MGREISYEFEFPKLETICDIDRCGSMPAVCYMTVYIVNKIGVSLKRV
jgi:hypothetical protein